MEARLLTIDSSTKKTGCAFFLNGEYINGILINCEKDKNMDSRFEAMSKALWAAFNEFHPNILYLEETVVPRNAQTQRFLTRLQGVVFAWCMIHECEFYTIRPTVWRKAVGMAQGKGVKREQLKEQAKQYVLERYDIAVNDDQAEAICIGDAVLALYGNCS